VTAGAHPDPRQSLWRPREERQEEQMDGGEGGREVRG